ncbi:MAG TPA: glycosyltransferase [Candidatus Binatia bacterium]|nr:glycosyltransferase [Candidatus Binatia bacterium]
MGPRAGSIALVAGGTAGHIAPAMAVAEELLGRSSDRSVFFVLSRRTPGQWLLQDTPFEVETIDSRAFYGNGWQQRLALPWHVLSNAAAARRLLRARGASLILAFGGYGCVDAALAAASLRIPVVVHEANARAGLSNRIAATMASRICLGMAAAAVDFPGARCVVTGNPVRRSFRDSRPPRDRRSGRRNLVVVGGSLGARFLDARVPELAAAVSRHGVDIGVTHFTGHRATDEVLGRYRQHGIEATVLQRTGDMAGTLSACDFVISQAGAMAVAEIAAVGVPALFVPLPGHAREHQAANLRALQERAALWWTQESDWDTEALARRLTAILADQRASAQASAQARAMSDPGAAAAIADVCLELCR